MLVFYVNFHWTHTQKERVKISKTCDLVTATHKDFYPSRQLQTEPFILGGPRKNVLRHALENAAIVTVLVQDGQIIIYY